MSVLACVWFVCTAAASAEATVTPLRGSDVTGSLVRLSDQGVELKTPAGPREFAASAMQSVQVTPAPVLPSTDEGAMAVLLVDGSLLAATGFRVESGKATVVLAAGPSIEVPTSQLAWARFGKQDASLQKQWQEITAKAATADRIVMRKIGAGAVGGTDAVTVALDDLQGLLSDVREDAVDFVFDGSSLKVPRKKVEGVVYFHPPGKTATAQCRLIDLSGSTWCLKSILLQSGTIDLVTACGVRCQMPATQWAKLDFSAGNLVFLSEMKPESVLWQPYVGSPAISETLSGWFQPRFNQSAHGGPLMLNGQSYDRGMAVHSRTLLAYRLTDDYQRFLATVGVDDRFRGHGTVRLVVLGERGQLFEKLIRGRDEPFDLDVDIRGVRRLQILVDYGDDRSDSGDHLNLCNARLTK